MIYPKGTDIYVLIMLTVLVVWHLFKRKTIDESLLGRRPFLVDAVLFILTAGIAMYGWLLKTTEILNKKAQRPISLKFQTATILYVFGVVLWHIVLNRYFTGYAQSSDGQNISRLFSVAASFLTITWCFEIRRLVMERTDRKYSAVMTFLFSAFYCAYMIRKTFKEPVQRRALSRRTRLIITYASGIVGLILISFPITIGLRHYVFSSITADHALMKKQAGYWRRVTTGSKSYELIYELSEDGNQTFSAVYFSENGSPAALLDVKSHSKIAKGSYYDRTWSSKISVDTVIEMTENSRVVRENEVNHDVLRDVRITKEEFDRIRSDLAQYQKLSPVVMVIGDLFAGPGIYNSQIK